MQVWILVIGEPETIEVELIPPGSGPAPGSAPDSAPEAAAGPEPLIPPPVPAPELPEPELPEPDFEIAEIPTHRGIIVNYDQRINELAEVRANEKVNAELAALGQAEDAQGWGGQIVRGLKKTVGGIVKVSVTSPRILITLPLYLDGFSLILEIDVEHDIRNNRSRRKIINSFFIVESFMFFWI